MKLAPGTQVRTRGSEVQNPLSPINIFQQLTRNFWFGAFTGVDDFEAVKVSRSRKPHFFRKPSSSLDMNNHAIMGGQSLVALVGRTRS
jgi:hypothetical protein